MPPKGRRGSLATIALRKTAPHWSSETRRCCSAGSRVHAEAAEAEGGVVGDGDGLVEVVHAEEHGDGAEELFAVDGGGAGDSGEDGGLEVVAVADHALAAGEDAARRRWMAALTWASSSSRMRGGGEGADVGCVLHGVADFHGFHAGDEAGFEGVVDLFGDEEALGGDAGLAGVDAAGADGGFDGERRGRRRA